MNYAFSFDASACSGCKACQAACKDKNNLPLGVLWRRVYEVGGGDWTRSGDAWTSTVYAYNLSIACNHCVHPKCAGVCPVDAYTVREDGIVLLDSSRCIGCGYCTWACPYGAPQYDPTSGTMTKCDLCFDNLDAGLPPACVAACPLRVLELANQAELEAHGHRFQVVFPMPPTSRTEPRVYIKPHPAALQAAQAPEVLNREESAPQRRRSWAWAAREEVPLLVFTLFGQMAAGVSWILGLLILLSIPFPHFLYLSIGAILGTGLIVSFLHLGSPRNAWRVFRNIKKSSLSREVLAAVSVMLTWAISTMSLLQPGTAIFWRQLMAGMTGLASVTLVFGMADVYRLRMVPAWDTWHTMAAFFLSAMVLGGGFVGAGWVLSSADGGELPGLLHTIGAILVLTLSLELVLTGTENSGNIPAVGLMRGILIAVCILLASLMVLAKVQAGFRIVFVIFLLALLEQVAGRWLFYSKRNPSM